MGMSVGGAAINMHEGFISIPYYPPATMTHGIADQRQRPSALSTRTCTTPAWVTALPCNSSRDRLYFVLNMDDYGDLRASSIILFAPDLPAPAKPSRNWRRNWSLRKGSLATDHAAMYNEDCAAGERTPSTTRPAEWLEKPLEPPLVALDVTPGRGAFIPLLSPSVAWIPCPPGKWSMPQRQVVPGLYAAGRTACGVVRRAEGYSSAACRWAMPPSPDAWPASTGGRSRR